MNKEEIDILYSFANDEDCRYVYDWQGFNYEEICPLIDKLIKENKKYKEVIDKAIKHVNKYESIKAFYEYIDEDGYDEYNDDEDFKKELLDILKEVE